MLDQLVTCQADVRGARVGGKVTGLLSWRGLLLGQTMGTRKLTHKHFAWVATQIRQLEVATFGQVRGEVDGCQAAIKEKMVARSRALAERG